MDCGGGGSRIQETCSGESYTWCDRGGSGEKWPVGMWVRDGAESRAEGLCVWGKDEASRRTTRGQVYTRQLAVFKGGVGG